MTSARRLAACRDGSDKEHFENVQPGWRLGKGDAPEKSRRLFCVARERLFLGRTRVFRCLGRDLPSIVAPFPSREKFRQHAEQGRHARTRATVMKSAGGFMTLSHHCLWSFFERPFVCCNIAFGTCCTVFGLLFCGAGFQLLCAEHTRDTS